MKIAFLGAGNMGVPMALNVLRAGHEVKAFNRTPAKMTALRQEGATIVNSPLEAVEGVGPGFRVNCPIWEFGSP